jgi:hypothetical protein
MDHQCEELREKMREYVRRFRTEDIPWNEEFSQWEEAAYEALRVQVSS